MTWILNFFICSPYVWPKSWSSSFLILSLLTIKSRRKRSVNNLLLESKSIKRQEKKRLIRKKKKNHLFFFSWESLFRLFLCIYLKSILFLGSQSFSLLLSPSFFFYNFSRDFLSCTCLEQHKRSRDDLQGIDTRKELLRMKKCVLQVKKSNQFFIESSASHARDKVRLWWRLWNDYLAEV